MGRRAAYILCSWNIFNYDPPLSILICEARRTTLFRFQTLSSRDKNLFFEVDFRICCALNSETNTHHRLFRLFREFLNRLEKKSSKSSKKWRNGEKTKSGSSWSGPTLVGENLVWSYFSWGKFYTFTTANVWFFCLFIMWSTVVLYCFVILCKTFML